jgi:hypothetical protein
MGRQTKATVGACRLRCLAQLILSAGSVSAGRQNGGRMGKSLNGSRRKLEETVKRGSVQTSRFKETTK